MAGRIPQTFIDDLLDRLDIVEVIDRRVKLKKSGKNFTACCPFHDEKTPSFSVNQEKQFYYCFGCGAGGNAIGFIMDYERMGFPQAVESLADSAGLEVPREATNFVDQQPQKQNIYKLLEAAAEFYREQLKNHPQKQQAISYLQGRGLSGEICRDFDIGYAPPGWDNLLKTLAKNEEDRMLLIDGGMLIDKPEEQKCYDRFRERIIFPIRDNRGRVIAFGGRVLGDDKPKYLNSPETPVFHKGKELYGFYQARKANRKLERLLIVEGYMDVVALAQHGISWAAATLGTATSTEHLRRVFRQCPEVIFCFDGDEAGRKAAVRALESALPAMEDGRQARFLFLPQGEDPDSLVREIGAAAFIRKINQEAQPLEEYLFNAAADGLQVDTLDGRARLSTKAAPLIDQLPDGIFKELMMDSLAERTGLSRDKLGDILSSQRQQQAAIKEAQTQAEQTAKDDEPAIRPVKNPRQRQPINEAPLDSQRDPLRYAIALVLHEPRAVRDVDIPSALSLEENELGKLLLAMLELVKKRPDSSTSTLIGNWIGEPWGETLQALLSQEQFISGTHIEQELADTLAHIERGYRQQTLAEQLDSLLVKDYEQLSDDELQQLKGLLEQKQRL